MKITRAWATPVRPPAGYDAPTSWLSESLVANPMSVYTEYEDRRSSCLMLDRYMAWDLEFSPRLAEALRPYGIRWIEECLPRGIHWLLAQAPLPWAEYVVIASPEDGELRPLLPFLRGVPQPPDGFLTPSELPGLGIEVDSDWLGG